MTDAQIRLLSSESTEAVRNHMGGLPGAAGLPMIHRASVCIPLLESLASCTIEMWRNQNGRKKPTDNLIL
jgi:hypothetical protein